MAFESFKFWSNKPKRGEHRIKKEDENNGMSRRDFLKKAGIVAGLVALETPTVKKFIEETPTILKWADKLANLEGGNDEDEKETSEQREIFEEDAKSLDEILSFKKKGKIDLNLETAEQVKNYWKERYSNPKSKLSNDLKRAYTDIGEWLPYLEDIFEKEDVPKKYAYLAIPESHWRPDAVSPAKAVGPYQFMKETAKTYHLKMDNWVDERKDPLKSARACAQNLKHLYNKTGDWDLVLSGYNGNKIWDYLEERPKDEKISYKIF
jgi:soluble cytochrome b562